MGAGKGHLLPEGGGGEGVNHLPKKTLASCPNFYETVEKEQGSYDKLTKAYIRTYAYGCYHLFFQLNNGVIIMEWIQ